MINDVIKPNLLIREECIPHREAERESGLLRSKAVTQPDETILSIEIDDPDRQVCGGTHLLSTGLSCPIHILKVDDNGRHNRRLRLGLNGVYE